MQRWPPTRGSLGSSRSQAACRRWASGAAGRQVQREGSSRKEPRTCTEPKGARTAPALHANPRQKSAVAFSLLRRTPRPATLEPRSSRWLQGFRSLTIVSTLFFERVATSEKTRQPKPNSNCQLKALMASQGLLIRPRQSSVLLVRVQTGRARLNQGGARLLGLSGEELTPVHA